MNLSKSIRERCHVNKNDENDRFVGVKADTNDAIIYFPLGYQLPQNDDELRMDIENLFYILEAFMKEDKLIEESKFSRSRNVNFPMHAYIKIVRDFLRTGRYYIEKDPYFKTDTKGNISWSRTIRKQRALIQKNGSLIFTNMTVRFIRPSINKKITQIHRYCVYEAFDKIGWLYVPYMPEKLETYINIKEAIYIIDKKLEFTHNDMEQELFSAMSLMLKYMDKTSSERKYSFGTDFFERIWEKMIDKAFGIKDKNRYFPRTKWFLDYSFDKSRTPLQPDTIMIYNDKVYVIDAKLYRYGYSGNPAHLPNGPDINKQITYGEYIERTKGISSDKLYNAFIMPFNRQDNPFFDMGPDGVPIPCITENIGNIGEAVGDWKPNPKNYERVQGIVIDTRFLMQNYISMSEKQKCQLAKAIEKVNDRGSILEPKI